jgi:hypothetical protein
MSIPPGTLFVASDEYLRGDYGLKAWLMVGFSAAGFFTRARTSSCPLRARICLDRSAAMSGRDWRAQLRADADDTFNKAMIN